MQAPQAPQPTHISHIPRPSDGQDDTPPPRQHKAGRTFQDTSVGDITGDYSCNPSNGPDREGRDTVPACSSLAEAKHWLLCESIGGYASQANEIRAALMTGGKVRSGAMAWLHGVASEATLKASWARLVLRELGVQS